ncbi:hypothetical protein ACN38_g9730 [Penicillium nordicum]|uniref:Uncharacterized protein n=1 Tax=Penicillium nordicum TaxID=229535 RepID=A0A0M9WCF9_9EURO|nr:hypothetical protein ACN38_g9730 [Penicillium nordicum]
MPSPRTFPFLPGLGYPVFDGDWRWICFYSVLVFSAFIFIFRLYEYISFLDISLSQTRLLCNEKTSL